MLGNELKLAIHTHTKKRIIAICSLVGQQFQPSFCLYQGNPSGTECKALNHPHRVKTWHCLILICLDPLRRLQVGTTFSDDNKVKKAMHDWLHIQLKKFIFDGIRNF